ncbi:outer membrane transport energization protein ExbD [Pedobacter psychrotolerans]|uniref:Biopolymer transport ExbD protein n=1 Tax=Pedobacter psychrotolerans TaxID=1843235 RepID=A0A4R2HGY1_9SPHI|nr:biopolymer transporter ExbD [Pedobacter psychrotolerans]TCO26786.1 outer membrane transport energization protein ExbD [Pedobacter psychrotolerans]GGE56518.1 biopolymer transport ExbD protein [Pedobacter psychrotolerans]
MATLNESPRGKTHKGKTRKTAPRVDLTAMVDLMFLLTTFFMLTTSLGTLNAADVAKPDPCNDCTTDYPASRTMTILLGNNNMAISFLGTPEGADMKLMPVREIDKQIMKNKLAVAKAHHNDKGKHMLVIIKPGKNAQFQDFVDVIDEMKIADIKSYSIDDQHFNPLETKAIDTNDL